jgi:hypothetical protein
MLRKKFIIIVVILLAIQFNRPARNSGATDSVNEKRLNHRLTISHNCNVFIY